ncbi:hypothetical protein FV242_32735 [Methylobacterium sp. WL64]|uniref:hypothetical protein n=1 Tax=Methylobacterium sp. WL64 TaxID=2603894 RepID=UPI0011C89DFB|nr:hypothetical protein [Methylobacterium sp. WL64]TXM96958.1 hypothetical protein FV242_32735 [Methylobacterium sp. WL64]
MTHPRDGPAVAFFSQPSAGAIMLGPDQSPQFGAGFSPAAQQMQKPALVRVLNVARILTSTGALFGVSFMALQVVMPVGNKPSDWLGETYGLIESAEAEAKRIAIVETARRTAEETAREQGKVQMEIEILKHQMQTLHESYEGQIQQANIADWLCTLGQAVPDDMLNNDTRKIVGALRKTCGFADAIRRQQQEEYAELAMRNAALIARSDTLHRKYNEAAAIAHRGDLNRSRNRIVVD